MSNNKLHLVFIGVPMVQILTLDETMLDIAANDLMIGMEQAARGFKKIVKVYLEEGGYSFINTEQLVSATFSALITRSV